jgi:hypothetical protein
MLMYPLGRVGPGLAERGDRRVDEAGVHPAQVVVAQAEALHGAHAEVLAHHVGVADELAEELDAGRGLQIERDAELVAIAVLRGGHPLLDAVAPPLHAERDALAPALRRLDLDHPRAHVGEQHRAEGHRDDLAQIEHRDVVERLIHGEWA